MCGNATARQVKWMFQQPACLELTHNHGTEDDPDWQAHSGNAEPKGYGHIGFHGARAPLLLGALPATSPLLCSFSSRIHILCAVSFRGAVRTPLPRLISPV